MIQYSHPIALTILYQTQGTQSWQGTKDQVIHFHSTVFYSCRVNLCLGHLYPWLLPFL